MEGQIIVIDFGRIKNEMDVMLGIDGVFGFNEGENINWNAISDDIRSNVEDISKCDRQETTQ